MRVVERTVGVGCVQFVFGGDVGRGEEQPRAGS